MEFFLPGLSGEEGSDKTEKEPKCTSKIILYNPVLSLCR